MSCSTLLSGRTPPSSVGPNCDAVQTSLGRATVARRASTSRSTSTRRRHCTTKARSGARVGPRRGPAFLQDQAERVTPLWNNSVGRQAPWTGRRCHGRPPTATVLTRSAELLDGTSDDLTIRQSFHMCATIILLSVFLNVTVQFSMITVQR